MNSHEEHLPSILYERTSLASEEQENVKKIFFLLENTHPKNSNDLWNEPHRSEYIKLKKYVRNYADNYRI